MSLDSVSAITYSWMTGFDAVFDEVFVSGTRDYKVARDKISIFACKSSEWDSGNPEITICGYSHVAIREDALDIKPFSHSPSNDRIPELAYMKGAFAAAKALNLTSTVLNDDKKLDT